MGSACRRRPAKTRSDIQEEFYKVITEQIETFDPEYLNLIF
jgi:hypothetical protein